MLACLDGATLSLGMSVIERSQQQSLGIKRVRTTGRLHFSEHVCDFTLIATISIKRVRTTGNVLYIMLPFLNRICAHNGTMLTPSNVSEYGTFKGNYYLATLTPFTSLCGRSHWYNYKADLYHRTEAFV